MKYSGFSNEQLLQLVEQLEILNHQLLKEQEQDTRLEYAWTGNLGHWYWNIKTNAVTFNPLKITNLGYKEEDLPSQVTYQFFTDKLHPEDFQNTMDAMLKHLYGGSGVYEAEYRIQAKDGSYKWYYDRGKITQYDEAGKPVFLAGIVFDITEKKEMQLDLEYKNGILAELSSIDGLTRISNHRTLLERLEYEISEANRANKPLSLAMFDIDDFKKVNDRKGHVVGDKVLVDIAKIIQENTRATDLAGRYGGEEFMVILPNTDLSVASIIAERIRKAIAEYGFIDEFTVTISGGVKKYSGEDLYELVHAADVNLYEAKRLGKNRIVF
ncbi:MAG: diguanylate cyclase [Clostridia bacterium]|nr:diguanylate cyclase [Clostridia bacterium]